MSAPDYRVRTVEILHLVDGLWSSSAFIHRSGEEKPCEILLHAGRSRCKEEAEHLARLAADRWLRASLVAEPCSQPPRDSRS